MIKKIGFILSICTLGLLWQCSDTGEMRNVDLDESAFLVNTGSNIILPAYEDLLAKTASLNEAILAFSITANKENLDALKLSLKKARLSWQGSAMYGFGPASNILLLTQFNIYPADVYQIEKNIESGIYDLSSLSNNDTKGFPGIAYLLYGNDKTEADIIAQFTTKPLAQNSIQYLKDLGTNMEVSITSVLNDWKNNYLTQFTDESAFGTSVGSSTSQLFNTLVQSFERETREGKIGIPAGVRSLGEIIPTSTEAYHGGYSAELAAESIAQIQTLFNGKEEMGLDDYLVAYGNEDLVKDINAKFKEVLNDIDALNDPLAAQIEADKTPAETVFIGIQGLVNLLKTDVASQLSISITFVDMDGD